MKVLQLNTVSGISSTGRIATDIAQMLESKGSESKIIYGIGNSPEHLQKYGYKIGSDFSVHLHSAISQFFDGEGYGSQKATRQAINFAKEYNPDVIHMHNIHGCYLNSKIWFDYLKQAKKPIVWTMHDCWSFTGHCAYFDFAQCNKWQSLCKNCPQSKVGYPRNYIFDFSTRNFKNKKASFTGLSNATLVPPSKWLGDLLKKSYLKEYPVNVIYNGVDRSIFKPTDATALIKKYNLEGKYVLLGIANDWDQRKGLQYILELNKRLDNNFVFALIGLSKSQIEGMPNNIIALERTSSTKELAQWYSLASLLVNPTLEDNMPLVNLEAFACGTPVAVFATGGCVEVVNDNVGKVVPKGDVDALEQAIKAIAPNKGDYMLNCLEHSKAFDKNLCYENYIKLYEEVSK